MVELTIIIKVEDVGDYPGGEEAWANWVAGYVIRILEEKGVTWGDATWKTQSSKESAN